MISKKPKVSIIYPFYNCEKYINKSLSALEYLKSSDFEIILINDGSTDNSLEIAQKATERLSIDSTILDRTVNQGCFKARTEAIEASRGQYIAIYDADDIILPIRLEKQLEMLENNPKMWCIAGWATKIDENGKILGKMEYTPQTNKKMIELIKKDPTINPIIDPTTMFRKEIFYELGGYSLDKEKNLVSDMFLWLKGLSSDKVFGIILEPLILYTHRLSGNTNKFKRKMIKQHIKARKEFLLSLKTKKKV